MVMKGRPLAKAGYEQELVSIRSFIAMQNKADSGPQMVPTTDKPKVCVCVCMYGHGGLYLGCMVGSI